MEKSTFLKSHESNQPLIEPKKPTPLSVGIKPITKSTTTKRVQNPFLERQLRTQRQAEIRNALRVNLDTWDIPGPEPVDFAEGLFLDDPFHDISKLPKEAVITTRSDIVKII